MTGNMCGRLILLGISNPCKAGFSGWGCRQGILYSEYSYRLDTFLTCMERWQSTASSPSSVRMCHISSGMTGQIVCVIDYIDGIHPVFVGLTISTPTESMHTFQKRSTLAWPRQSRCSCRFYRVFRCVAIHSLENFSRIHQPVRVQCVLDAAHHTNCVGSELL